LPSAWTSTLGIEQPANAAPGGPDRLVRLGTESAPLLQKSVNEPPKRVEKDPQSGQDEALNRRAVRWDWTLDHDYEENQGAE
jgi:hypothetical protein